MNETMCYFYVYELKHERGIDKASCVVRLDINPEKAFDELINKINDSYDTVYEVLITTFHKF